MTNPKRAKKSGGDMGDDKAQPATLEEAQHAQDLNEMSSGDENDDDESDAEDSSEEDDLVDSVVNVDFEAFPPDDSDFHGIRKLLQQVFRNSRVNVSDLAKHLIELNKLSVILRQADEDMEEDEEDDNDDVYGVTGVVPLGGDRDGVKSVRNFLLEKAGDVKNASIRSKLEPLLASGSVGLLVSERFVNIPPRVALPLLESIHGDWKEVKKSVPSLSKIQHIILICKQYAGAKDSFFANGEEELFVDLAELQFDFEVPRQDADTALSGKWRKSDEELKHVRKVLLLDTKKLSQMIQLVKENV
ncbi:protein BCCIP-like [Tropilaelaps mercedesae]|uniref:Protein BCCIP-like n=1 Tax=Tropilaelaps mercedesae TaxID=418985 RepID=A0A1V9XR90_9ACAR|nr:protein BCCIP-like [Tropilaelaps mercedesae]